MEYLDFLVAGVAAVAVGAMIYVGYAAIEKTDFTNADADMVALAVAATYVSVMIALRPRFF